MAMTDDDVPDGRADTGSGAGKSVVLAEPGVLDWAELTGHLG
jgi:hypothetical protein